MGYSPIIKLEQTGSVREMAATACSVASRSDWETLNVDVLIKYQVTDILGPAVIK